MAENPNGPDPDAPDPADDADDASAEPEVIGGQALVEQFVDAGIMLEDEQVDDLRLTDDFREAWWGRIETVRDEEHARTGMGALVDIETEELTFEERGDKFVAFHGDTELGDWPSRAAFVADVALQPTMGEWLQLWERIDPLSRAELLARLRAFLESCPVCEGELEMAERTTGAGRTEVSIACVDCGQVTVSGEMG